jgi:hypothetical protein
VNQLLRTRNIFVAVVFLGLLALAVRNVADPDVWWHLKTGELIAATKSVPHTDPFSFTRPGQPWVAHEWLSELFIYGIYHAAGWGGLIVIFAAIVAAAFFFLYLRCGKNLIVAGLITLWAAWATAPIWGVRPQVLSFLLTSVWLLILERSERNRTLLWWTLPLTVLWVNLHAGFALGLVLLGLFFAGELIEHLLSTQVQPNSTRLRALALTLFLDLLLVPLNPNGTRMYSYPLETLRSRAMQTYIAEWASPNFHRSEYWLFLLMLLATVATLACTKIRVPHFSRSVRKACPERSRMVGIFVPRPRARDIFLLLIATWAALSSIRMIPLFVLVAAPLVASAGAWNSREQTMPRPLSPTRLFVNALIVLGMAAFVTIHTAQVVRRQPASEADHFPAAAVAYLQAHSPAGPLFNHYDWGGYLIWKLYPGTRVFIDGRADLYGEPLLNQFANTYQFKNDWQTSLDQWHIATVVVPRNSALAAGLQHAPNWVVQYQDSQSAILVHLNPDESSLIR